MWKPRNRTYVRTNRSFSPPESIGIGSCGWSSVWGRWTCRPATWRRFTVIAVKGLDDEASTQSRALAAADRPRGVAVRAATCARRTADIPGESRRPARNRPRHCALLRIGAAERGWLPPARRPPNAHAIHVGRRPADPSGAVELRILVGAGRR